MIYYYIQFNENKLNYMSYGLTMLSNSREKPFSQYLLLNSMKIFLYNAGNDLKLPKLGLG